MPRPYYRLLLNTQPEFLVNALATVNQSALSAKTLHELGGNDSCVLGLEVMIKELVDLLTREIPDPELPALEPIDFIEEGKPISTRKLSVKLALKDAKERRALKRDLSKLLKDGKIEQVKKGWWQKVAAPSAEQG